LLLYFDKLLLLSFYHSLGHWWPWVCMLRSELRDSTRSSILWAASKTSVVDRVSPEIFHFSFDDD